jgi:hypothetical protein
MQEQKCLLATVIAIHVNQHVQQHVLLVCMLTVICGCVPAFSMEGTDDRAACVEGRLKCACVANA